ncbi:MAG: hypothetical protein E6Q98_05310 [Rhodospirillaceae bacterium]|nr:MAG: hypothetical protein E6Q98_05310 [Rhodospirillaceae bacterium]
MKEVDTHAKSVKEAGMKTTRNRAAGCNDAAFTVILGSSTFLMAASFVADKLLLSDGFPSILLVG